MTLYFDLDSALLVSSPGTRDVVTSLAFKRGDSCTLSIQFVSSGVVQELDSGATGKLGIKAAGDYAGDYIAAAPTWTKTGTLTDTVYSFSINLATDEINALLSGSTPLVAAIAELEFIVGSIRTSSQTIPVTIYNDVIKGTESGPTDVATGSPVNGVAATLTVDPAGSNNSVLYTAAATGTTGNAISIAYTSPAAGSLTGVSVTGPAISVTPVTNARVTTTGTTPALAECGAVNYGAGLKVYNSDGQLSYAPPGFGAVTGRTAWYSDGTAWFVWQWNTAGTVLYAATITSAAATPDLVVGTWTVTTGTGQPVITAATTTAAQVIAAINATPAAAALVIASAYGTVTGPVASFSAANLSGGVTQTPGIPGCMSVDASYLYVVNSAGTWKKLALSSL